MSNRLRFRMGQSVITPAAQPVLEQAGISPTALLGRHLRGDWGELDIADVASNELALLIHRRLLSSYVIPGGSRVWIITEADRSVTTILLPEDY
ncbi:hypothetical protein WL74_00760 [Burkholderia cepacia]|uniref:hypothetical protein n=1 Tax=Burkholderia TaxID=32008 RepID=UPI000530ED29|nr:MULTISPECIES: hypothetical protein [Burkholderia]KAA8767722.1 hypothetical protein F5D26_14125 [Burkholderia pseudomallei]KGS17779.1 putative type I restriction-modification system methyltransferase subunit [Burkholderia pseudomallei MSHR4378]KGW58958.1 putative type I restriction-modification system methyltransferase subunit [Burkholderia pseudomallei MSHR1357]KGW65558.1 putative type I restriction-modification system methyltransferase subunit [Burkholderia pseudomallei MSHR1029]KKC15602.1